MTETLRFQCPDNAFAQLLFGAQHQHLKILERNLQVVLSVRSGLVQIAGEEQQARLALRVLEELYSLLQTGITLSSDDVERAIKLLKKDQSTQLVRVYGESLFIAGKGRMITPKNPHQRDYLNLVKEHDLIFAVGPAGTGKTYLAVAMAVQALLAKEVSRIVLSRPAVEAGEKLGFLPGDLAEKVNPYLRPLYDALHDMLEAERIFHYIGNGVLEIAPLAFMRGRTLNESFIILDEAQNCTMEQMKMMLTRIGRRSRMVIAGDVTQTDLPDTRPSGLQDALHRLSGVKGIGIQYFTDEDVVRHELVTRIIRAYEAPDKK